METIFVILFYIISVLRNSVAFPEICSICRCETKLSSVCGLENRIAWLERNMMAANGKIVEWVKQQYHIRQLEAEIIMQKGEIIQLKKTVQNLEDKQQKLPLLLDILSQTTENPSYATIPGAPDTLSIYNLSQNLSSLHRRIDDMESKTIKNLTLEVIELKGDLQEKEFHHPETGFNKTIELTHNIYAEWEGMQQKIAELEISLADQGRKYDDVSKRLEQKFAGAEFSAEKILYFNDTWYRTLTAFNETLSLNQRDIKSLIQELSAGRNLENDLAQEKIKLEKLMGELTSLQEVVHVQDAKFSNNLSLMVNYVNEMNRRERDSIGDLKNYFHSAKNDWKKDNVPASSLDMLQGNRKNNNFFIRVGKSYNPEFNEENGDQYHHDCKNCCSPLDLSKSQHLAFKHARMDKLFYNTGDAVLFKCKDQLIMHGPQTATCLEKGEWSMTSLPSCVIRM